MTTIMQSNLESQTQKQIDPAPNQIIHLIDQQLLNPTLSTKLGNPYSRLEELSQKAVTLSDKEKPMKITNKKLIHKK